MVKQEEKELSNCQALWKAVIYQAIRDFYAKRKYSKRKIRVDSLYKQAKNFLQEDNIDFRIVCNLANLDYKYVLKHKEEIYEESFNKRVIGSKYVA